MDLSNSAVKTPDAESETATRIQPAKLLLPPPSSNGVLKRHPPLHLHHHGHPVVVTYKECLKNHAASLGGHAVDGCGEFMPSPASNPSDPTSLKCAACGCHRNFHRREPDEPLLLPNATAPALEYRPHHRHHPPPPIPPLPPHSGSPDNSPSPPPISSSYYPSAPHMLLALSHGLAGPPADGNTLIAAAAGINISSSPPLLSSNSRKRFRTKFTQNQKEKMLEFAERVGWKIQKKDEDLINGFCSDAGVERGVFKVWMHNNKSNFGKKDHQFSPPPPPTNNGGGMSYAASGGGGAAAEDSDSKENGELQELRHHHHHHDDDNSILGTTNGSSSS